MILAQLLQATPAPPAMLPAREQMGFTLGYHILLVPLGLVLPVLTLTLNAIGLRRKDAVAMQLARRWSVVMAIQFAIGVVTGTILSFEFGLLWPRMMGRFGDVFGLGFGIEGWAFFIEAIFLSIYLYGWKRLSPRTHFLVGLPLPFAAFMGAFGIISANSWMNTPAGFQLGPGGKPVNVDVPAAIFTKSFGYEYFHFMIAMYMTACFLVASVYAVGWLRGRRDRYHRLGFVVPFTIAAILTPVQLIVGDMAARAIVQDQPAKFSAMEVTWNTQSHNPEYIFGVLQPDGTVKYGIGIPDLDSLLVGFTPGTVVPGLTSVPADNRPTNELATIAHWAFDIMVGIASALFLLALWYGAAWVRRRGPPRSLWFYRAAAFSGVACYLAVESGWVVTEVGRQPWIVYNVMRVADAVNLVDPRFIWTSFSVLVVLYACIAWAFLAVLLKLSARWRREDLGEAAPPPEVDLPYGPRSGRISASPGGGSGGAG